MTEQAQAFANALGYLEGKDSLELSYRRQVVALYRIFSRYGSLLERQTAMEKNLIQGHSVAAGLGMLETRASQMEQAQSLQANLALILNLPGESPVPVPGTRPKLGYEKRIAGLVPGRTTVCSPYGCPLIRSRRPCFGKKEWSSNNGLTHGPTRRLRHFTTPARIAAVATSKQTGSFFSPDFRDLTTLPGASWMVSRPPGRTPILSNRTFVCVWTRNRASGFACASVTNSFFSSRPWPTSACDFFRNGIAVPPWRILMRCGPAGMRSLRSRLQRNNWSLRSGCGMTTSGNEAMRLSIRYTVAALAAALCAPAAAQHHPDLGNLAEFPVASEVWLGSLVGDVSVNPEFPVEVNLPGRLEWKVADGQLVAKDEVVAIIGAEKLKLSERDLDLKKSRYGNSVIDIEQSAIEKKQSLSNTIDEMEEKLTRMSLTDGEHRLLGAEFVKRLAEECASLEKEIKRSRDKLTGDYFELAEAADRRALDLEIERAELDHRELLRSSEVLAPVAGRITIDVTDSVRGTTVICRIIKIGLAEARLELADSYLRNIPGDELSIEVSGEDSRIYRGGFIRMLDQRALDRNARIMIFDVRSLDGKEPVPVTLNGSRMVRVFRVLAKPASIVSKKDLVFRFPKEIEAEGWAAFIEKRWPGVKVSYVAPRDLVVSPLNEN